MKKRVLFVLWVLNILTLFLGRAAIATPDEDTVKECARQIVRHTVANLEEHRNPKARQEDAPWVQVWSAFQLNVRNDPETQESPYTYAVAAEHPFPSCVDCSEEWKKFLAVFFKEEEKSKPPSTEGNVSEKKSCVTGQTKKSGKIFGPNLYIFENQKRLLSLFEAFRDEFRNHFETAWEVQERMRESMESLEAEIKTLRQEISSLQGQNCDFALKIVNSRRASSGRETTAQLAILRADIARLEREERQIRIEIERLQKLLRQLEKRPEKKLDLKGDI